VFHADRRKDMTKLIVAFRNFASVPKSMARDRNCCTYECIRSTAIFSYENESNFNVNSTSKFNVHGSVHRNNILIYIYNKMQRYTAYFIWKLLYMFRVVRPPIIRSKQLYIQHLVFVMPYCGCRTPPKIHSNQFQLFHDSGR